MVQFDPQDGPWKLVLRTYFREAIEFFFPDTARIIDWRSPPEFLDKEFQQIAPDSETGKRFADQLVKVRRKRGKELWLLIHTEVQASREAKFQERMFLYNLRIFDRFRKPAISLAILCDNNKTWKPTEYSFSYPGTELSFCFDVAKLLEYQARWPELEASSNPFATVVMAHLKTQETKKNATDRKAWKMRLVRGLYEQGYNRSDVINLFRFIDWSMALPQSLKQSFWQELQAFEEERRMPFVTSVEEIGFERGVKAGEARGRLEAERKLLRALFGRKLGDLPEVCEEAIACLASEQLEQLTLLVLELETIAALEDWLTGASRSQIAHQLSEQLESAPSELEAVLSQVSLQTLLNVEVQDVSSISDLPQEDIDRDPN